MHLFYQPALREGVCQLSEEEAQHAVRVMRMREGDRAWVTDGRGLLADVSITEAGRHGCHFAILSQQEGPQPALPSIAIAPTKHADRFEWLVEKAVEIGVGEICPILCANSERRSLNPVRAERIALSAMKQSQRLWLPAIRPLTPFADFLARVPAPAFIAHCREGAKTPLPVGVRPPCWLLIGPEGDFTHQEVESALRAGATPVSLGPARLRSETAGIFALSILSAPA